MFQPKISEELKKEISGSGIADAVFSSCSTKIVLKGLKDLEPDALLENATFKIELKSEINQKE